MMENYPALVNNFIRCVKGYHFINSEPINETVWEFINSQVLSESGCKVSDSSRGSHSSGRDIVCDIGGLSNKSAKYATAKGVGKTEFAISSYRLTTVCSDKECGSISEIIAEINRRKNYEYYSFILRNETEETFEYDWYLIPANEPVLSPENYEWSPLIGMRGKKAGQQIGWRTNLVDGSYMSITFSMSSQLWINIAVTESLKKYIVANCTVSRKPKLNYLQIYDLFSEGV